MSQLAERSDCERSRLPLFGQGLLADLLLGLAMVPYIVGPSGGGFDWP
jgi:hypothetical protein